jgi:hypothetical protein
MYASKIQETTDGGWRGARGQTRGTLEEFAQRCFPRNVQIDEQKRAAQNGQNQAQRQADEKTKATLSSRFGLHATRFGDEGGAMPIPPATWKLFMS